MPKSGKNIIWLKETEQADAKLVGGKNAALGEVYRGLQTKGVQVPNAFMITATAYYRFLKETQIQDSLEKIFLRIETSDLKQLRRATAQARRLILRAKWPEGLKRDVLEAYRQLSEEFGQKNTDVAVRASVAAAQTIASSFPGQQETFLGINREEDLLKSIKKCFASLFNNHAVIYRTERQLSLFDVALSVGVQKMVRSDLAASGVALTVEPESGHRQVIVISSAYGLGEVVVDGRTDPDEFYVFKPSLSRGYRAIIKRRRGQKKQKGVYGRWGIKVVEVPFNERSKFSLSDKDVLLLAQWCSAIEDYYSEKNGHYSPQEIEWAKDGRSGRLFIVQATPESVHRGNRSKVYRSYSLKTDQKPLLEGTAIGRKVVTGPIRRIKQARDLENVQPGDVLVTPMTDFKWVSVISQAGAVITDQGSRISHAAIISREYDVPAVIGAGTSTEQLRSGQWVTVDNSNGSIGRVYQGRLSFQTREDEIDKLPPVFPKVAINLSDSEEAFRLAALPISGVGLIREEFIILNEVKIHPKALCLFHQLESGELKNKIEQLTADYQDKREYFVDKLSQHLGVIAAAVWPRPAVMRFSDLKSNEYRQLIGGQLFEPKEENPILGWRGASRYYHPEFRSVFELECQAVKKVREEWGLTNLATMIPFCRTPEEGQRVLSLMAEFGLRKGVNGLMVYVMAELPSNIILADHFLDIFDGFSIGSNDLTQLVLGLDRDNSFIQGIGDERHLAIKQMIREAIEWGQATRKTVSVCGEGPAQFPELAIFLAERGIDLISVAPSAVIPTVLLLAQHGFTQHDSL